MKIFVLLIFIVVLSSACNSNVENSEGELINDSSEVNLIEENSITDVPDIESSETSVNIQRVTIPEDEEVIEFKDNHVYIRPHYSEPESLHEPDVILWESTASGEFIEVVVFGQIVDFEVVSLDFDKDANLIEKDVKFSVPKIIDGRVIISTYQPEGVPFELIKWKSSSGAEFSYYIQEYYTMVDDAVLWNIYEIE